MMIHWLALAFSMSQGIIQRTVPYSYGRFVTDIKESFPGASMAMLMSVASLGICIGFGLAVVALHVVRLLKYKKTIILGTVISTIGICTLSMALNEYQFLVGYIIYSFGCIFIVSTCTFFIGHIFPQTSRHHILATGLNMSCVPFAFITAMISNTFILMCGWRITYLLWGAVSILNAIITAYIFGLQEKLDSIATKEDSTVPEESHETFFEWIKKSKRKGVLLVLAFGLATFSKAIFCNAPAFILVKHGIALGFSKTDSSALVLYVGLTEVVTRLTFSFIGDRFLKGHILKLYIACILAGSAIEFLLGYTAREYYQLVLYAVAVGIATGPIMVGAYPLGGEIFSARFTNDVHAMYCFLYAIGLTIGLVIDGYIYDITGDFYNVFIMNGCIHIFSAICYTLLLIVH